MHETQVPSQGQEDPLDKGGWQATVHGGHKELDMAEQLSVRVHQTKIISKSWFCH